MFDMSRPAGFFNQMIYHNLNNHYSISSSSDQSDPSSDTDRNDSNANNNVYQYLKEPVVGTYENGNIKELFRLVRKLKTHHRGERLTWLFRSPPSSTFEIMAKLALDGAKN